MMVRRVVAGFGRTLITVGVLLLLFVSYQLWGTGIAQARLQNKAAKDFEQLLAQSQTPDELAISDDSAVAAISSDPSSDTTDPTVGPRTPVASPASSPQTPTTKVAVGAATPKETVTTLPKVRSGRSKMLRPKAGKALGRIVIKRIKMDQTVVEGADKESLKTGPGHYASTPMPGQPGNAAIACHRTTYGAPCFNLQLVRPGDEILVQTLQGKFRYIVEKQWVVSPKGPDARAVLAKTEENVLTLTTCEPQYSAKKRLIVRARLDGEAAAEDFFVEPEVPATTTTTTPPTTPEPEESAALSSDAGATASSVSPTGTEDIAGEDTEDGIDDTEANVVDTGASLQSTDLSGNGPIRSLFWFRGRQSVWMETGYLAMVCATIWVGAWYLARRRKLIARAVIYGVGFVFLFGPVLFFCFEHIARLLPESV